MERDLYFKVRPDHTKMFAEHLHSAMRPHYRETTEFYPLSGQQIDYRRHRNLPKT